MVAFSVVALAGIALVVVAVVGLGVFFLRK